MPIIHRRLPPTPKRGPRGQHFDEAVRRLAPYIAEAREAGHKSVQAIMNFLNDGGVQPPTGKAFNSGTMHRILVRLEELNLGPGPRSPSDGAKARPSRVGIGAGRRRAPRGRTITAGRMLPERGRQL
jgi:hypothetical protein